MQCGTCSSVYSMRKCTACNSIWCSKCASDGIGPYPRQEISFRCPYCGTHNKIVDAQTNDSPGNPGCAAIVAGAMLIPASLMTAFKFLTV